MAAHPARKARRRDRRRRARKGDEMADATLSAREDQPGARPWARRAAVTLGFVLAEEQFPLPELVDLGVQAEQAGFDAIWTSDHYEPWQDNQGHAGFAWVMLAALGQRTSRIRLGTGITCPTYRYRPAVVAEGFASLAQLSPDRIFLGVGTGEAFNEVSAGGGWGPYRERADRLVEAVAIIRRLWTGEWVDYQGTYYQIHHSRLYDPPPGPIPIFIAAAGEKSARLAGAHGDGWVTNSEMATKAELRQAFAEGARDAGKDAGALPILAEHFVVVGDRHEAERWANLWRFEGKADLLRRTDPIDIQRTAEREVPLESVYGKWPISADPAVHVQALQRLIDAGVTHIFVHSPQGDQARVIDFYGREVLPYVRRQEPDHTDLEERRGTVGASQRP